LRDRKEDIPLLVGNILEAANLKAQTPVKKIQNEVIQLLTRYPWPGNFPELESSIETMVFFAGKDTLTIDDIPLDILIKQMDMAETPQSVKVSVKQLQRQFERIYIRKVLERCHGNQSQAAKDLGLHRNTIVGKLKNLNLEEDYKRIVKRRREQGMGFRGI
jgi:DNA-binding NtrC family response regulator